MEQQEKPQWSLGAILANAERDSIVKRGDQASLGTWPIDSIQAYCVGAAEAIMVLDKQLSIAPMEEVTKFCECYGFDLKPQDAEALEDYHSIMGILQSTEEFAPNEKVFRLKMQNSKLGSANFRIIPGIIQVIVHLPEGKFAGFKPEPDEFGFTPDIMGDDKRFAGYITRNQFIFEHLLMIKLDAVAKSVEDLTMKMALEFRESFLTPTPPFPASNKKPKPKRKVDDNDDDDDDDDDL